MGPCEQPGAIAAIENRPGIGRPTATSGSPCVVPPGKVLIEAGYRYERTDGAAGTSILQVFPLAMLRAGLGDHDEVLLLPPALAYRTGANLGGVFVPRDGAEDVGIGFKRMLHDRPAYQDAAGLFYTAPTGAPGATGFSAGSSTYTLSYTGTFPVGARFGLSTTQQAIVVPQFLSYQPSLTLGYSLSHNASVLATEQITTPLSANGGTGNRGLLEFQCAISAHAVLDAEYEVNFLPGPPSFRQQAFGIGGAWLL